MEFAHESVKTGVGWVGGISNMAGSIELYSMERGLGSWRRPAGLAGATALIIGVTLRQGNPDLLETTECWLLITGSRPALAAHSQRPRNDETHVITYES
jgi:hypothetical protein